ncbi:General stress protein 26 [Paracoccus isoporae]|uniref:General stress protein 26 n=1 Tax=Paracoccus isoporae TaxID=591205 RepID=A0A1G7DPD2_9RHOB|nr:pyridoxamine 5'-phosphate oxidase family protein [Paracoccus isoporae]SDE53000.1 General stress protein 26 [Paracoccus isoporae]
MDRNTLIEAMRDMDLCFMATLNGEGGMTSRPMSNNAQVEWDGSNWFFSNGDTRKVAQIEQDPATELNFQGRDTWIALSGQATLHRDDKALFEKHWTKDLDQWFENGLDTPGLTLIEVVAERAECWGKPGDGVIEL